MRYILLLLTLLAITTASTQAQDDNPYARFGHKGKVLKTPQERQQFMLKIPNPDATSEIALVGIAPNEGKYYLFDATNEVIQEDTLMDDELSRFLSVDPLTSSYPMLTPYQFASNSPIAGIDLDGLEFLYTPDGKLLGKYGGWGGDKQNEVRIVDDQELQEWVESYLKGNKTAEWDDDKMHFYVTSDSGSTLFKDATTEVQENVATAVYNNIKTPKVKLYNNKVSIKRSNIPSEINEPTWGVGEANATFDKRFGGILNLNDLNLYSNYYNMVNDIIHEESHIVEIMNEGKSSAADVFSHFEVYFKQMKHSTFEKSTVGFQYSTRSNAVSFINNMAAWVSRYEKEYGKDSYTYKYYNEKYLKAKANYEKLFKTQLIDNNSGGGSPSYSDPSLKAPVDKK